MQEGPIRVLLLDEQALFRESLSRYLAAQPGIEVAGECGTSGEALEVLRGGDVDVVFLNFRHFAEGERGIVASARRAGFGGRFLVLAGKADSWEAANAIQQGASGVFLKTETPERLVEAIQLVANGAVWLDQGVIRVLAGRLAEPANGFDPERPARLSERERRVLLGVLGGLTNRKIGEQIGISEGSVKLALQQLFAKAGVRSRSRLVRVALEGSLGSVRQHPA